MRKLIDYPHGTVGRYKARGCRCSLCREANTENGRKHRDKNRKPKKEYPHGTVNRYRNLGCRCVECSGANALRSSNYRLKTDKIALKRLQKRGKLKHKYGVTQENFDNMYRRQDGKCAICGKIPTTPLNVDHDHGSGKVRALVCGNCNSGMGQFRDDPFLMEKAIRYLLYHQTMFVEAD